MSERVRYLVLHEVILIGNFSCCREKPLGYDPPTQAASLSILNVGENPTIRCSQYNFNRQFELLAEKPAFLKQ